MSFLKEWVSNIFDIDVTSMINIPHIIIQVIVFVVAMYVANLIWPDEKNKLLAVGFLAVVLIYLFV